MQTHIASVRSRRIAWDVREVVQHGLNADRVELALDAEWQECDSIVAVLAKSGQQAFRVDAAGGFYLPSALMEEPGPLRMCLIGYAGDSLRVVTAKEVAPLVVVESGETGGTDPTPEQPDLWAQLMEEVRKATDGAKTAAQSATRAEADLRAAAERGDFDGEDGETPVRGVDYWTAEDRKPIEDATLAAATAAGRADAAAATATEGEASRVVSETARAKAEQARAIAETGRVEAEKVRVIADAERGERVDAAVQKADAATAEATEAAGKAETAATEANAAGKRAEEAAKGASDNVLKGAGCGTLVNVDDAWPSPVLKAKVLGQSNQVTTKGDQLFRPIAGETANGVTFTANVDGSYHVKGTQDKAFTRLFSDGGAKVPLADFGIKPGDTVYLSCAGASAKCYACIQFFSDGPDSYTMVAVSSATSTYMVPETITKAFCFISLDGTVGTSVNVELRPMLSKSRDAAWEPYTGGKPSPSPEYPQEITNLNKAEIVTCGKNLINVSKEAVSDKCATQTNGYKIENGVITFTSISSWGADYIFFNEANVLGVDKLTFSMKATKAVGTSNSNGAKFLCKAFDSEGKEIKVEQGLSTKEYEWGYNEYYKAYCQLVPNNTLTITLRPNIAKIRFGVCFSDTQAGTNVEIRDFQIEADSKATTYEPHQSKSTVIDLKGNELLSIPGGVKDEVVIDAEGNVSLIKRLWKLSRCIGDMNNNETYPGWQCANAELIDAVGSGIDIQPRGMSTHFQRFSINTKGVTERGGIIYVTGYKQSELIANYPDEVVTFIGERKEPQTIQLGKVELPALPEATSNVWNDGNIPANVYVQYLKDVNIAFADLESKLTQAVVAAAANL